MSFSDAVRAISEATDATKTVDILGQQFVLKKMSIKEALLIDSLLESGDVVALLVAVVRGGVVIEEGVEDTAITSMPMELATTLGDAVNAFNGRDGDSKDSEDSEGN